MPNRAPITVEGLARLRRDLRELGDAEKLVEVREALKQGAEVVAADARHRVPSKSGKTAASIRATAGGNKAYVKGGKKAVPYYGWLDFGSREPVLGNPRSIGPWAGSGTGPQNGRFIYPALADKGPEVVRLVDHALDAVTHRMGF